MPDLRSREQLRFLPVRLMAAVVKGLATRVPGHFAYIRYHGFSDIVNPVYPNDENRDGRSYPGENHGRPPHEPLAVPVRRQTRVN